MADEVARIGALSKGSNGQRSIESAPLLFGIWLLACLESRPFRQKVLQSGSPCKRAGERPLRYNEISGRMPRIQWKRLGISRSARDKLRKNLQFSN